MDRSATKYLGRVLTAFALATVLAVVALDRPIATWSHGLHRPAWCVWLTWLADVPAPGAVLALGVIGISALRGMRPGPAARVLLVASVSTLVAVAAVFVLKSAFGRPWPETWVANNPSWIGTHTYWFFPFHGGIGWSSFPSGHLATITAPGAALWPHTRRWRPVLAALPVLVAIGLLGANFHFLGDCIGGTLLGIASAASVGLTLGLPPDSQSDCPSSMSMTVPVTALDASAEK